MTRPWPLFVVFLAMASMVVPAIADLLSDLPASHDRLQPVPELDTTGAEPRAQQAIRSAREQVIDLLGQPDTSAAELAEVYGRLGAYYDVYQIRSGAEISYLNALTLDPSEFRWAFLHAYLAYASGLYEEALERFQRARAIDPTHPSVNLFEAEILLELNRVEDAEPKLRAAVEVDGLRARAAFRLGQVALQRRQFDEAAALFKLALETDPEGGAAWFPLAQALRGSGDAEGARAALAKRGRQLPRVREPLLEQLEALDRGSRPFYLSGLAAARKGDYVAAADAFEQGLLQDPGNVFARISYARALYLCGRLDESREQLEIASEQAPGESLPVFLIGLLDRAAGDNDVARIRFEQLIEANPEHSGALYFLGLLDFDAGNYKLAAERLDAALEAEPGNQYAQILALVARQRSGTPDSNLVADLTEIVSVSPQQWLPRYALARLLAVSEEVEVRDVERALELSRRLVEEQAHPSAFEALALAEAAGGNFSAAGAALDQAKSAYLYFGRFADMNRIARQQQRLDKGELPAAVWPAEDPLFNPPVISARGPFMEYPAARAY